MLLEGHTFLICMKYSVLYYVVKIIYKIYIIIIVNERLTKRYFSGYKTTETKDVTEAPKHNVNLYGAIPT